MAPIPVTLSSILLTEKLLSEKKQQAMNIVKLLSVGMLPLPNGNGLQKTEDMTAGQFKDAVQKLAGAAASRLSLDSGAYSAVMFELGNGPVECVLKMSHQPDLNDQAYQYLKDCQEKGGRSYCTGIPDVYYVGTAKTLDGEFSLAIMEYAKVDRTANKEAAEWLESYVHRALKNPDIKPSAEDISHAKDMLGWSPLDLYRFVGVVVPYGKWRIDIHTGNMGIREDGTVCVFDPIA